MLEQKFSDAAPYRMPPPTHPKRASSRLPLHAPYVCFCLTGLPLPASGVFKNCGPVTARTACTCRWPAPGRGRARAQPSLHDHVALVVALSRRLVELVPQGRAGHDWARRARALRCCVSMSSRLAHSISIQPTLSLQALRKTSCATCASALLAMSCNKRSSCFRAAAIITAALCLS